MLEILGLLVHLGSNSGECKGIVVAVCVYSVHAVYCTACVVAVLRSALTPRLIDRIIIFQPKLHILMYFVVYLVKEI